MRSCGVSLWGASQQQNSDLLIAGEEDVPIPLAGVRKIYESGRDLARLSHVAYCGRPAGR